MRSSLFFSLCFFCLSLYSQTRSGYYTAEIGGVTTDRSPFWLHTNTFGKLTGDTYLWGSVGVGTPFSKTDTRAFDYSFGFEGTGALGGDKHRIFINQLFGQVRWQNLVLDVGIVHPKILYDGLSSSNGDMLYSTNSRSLPGINLHTADFIRLPWIGKWVSFKARYGEYIMIDDRYAGNRTRLHNKMLDIKLTPIPQFSIEAGIDHYAQWGGETPKDGKLPTSLKDYIRVVLIKAGGDDAPANEINKLGNHIGNQFLKLKYNAERWGAEFYFDHIFEDGSGEKFRNRPDGLYGLYFTRKKNFKWFKSFVYEFYYTKCQSGPFHNDPVSGVIIGGNDNYFNNGIYQSGWTFFGQVIGAPFFTPRTKEENGLVLGIFNNRFHAHHVGLCGDLPAHIRYKLMVSYSRNYGTHSVHFIDRNGEYTHRSQVSCALELTLPDKKLPFNTALNIGFDKGDLLKDSFGVMLRIFKTGIF